MYSSESWSSGIVPNEPVASCGMLEAERVPGLVQHRQVGVISGDRIVVVVGRVVEPGIAALARDVLG